MLPDILFRSFRSNSSSKGRRRSTRSVEIGEMRNCELQLPSFSVPPKLGGGDYPVLRSAGTKFVGPDLSTRSDRNPWIKTKKMATKVSNFSDLIQRVTASCLLHPLGAGRHDSEDFSDINPVEGEGSGDDNRYIYKSDEEYEDFDDELDGERNQSQRIRAWGAATEDGGGSRADRLVELEILIGDVFEVVSAMKRAYVSLQEAHCPWDPDKMRVADGAVVAELRRLGVFRERFRRSAGCGDGRGRIRAPPGLRLKEVVAPYEAAVEELKREMKVKESEVENLREKLKTATSLNGSGGGKKGRSHSHQSKRKVHCSQAHVELVVATPELFESTMNTVIEAAKSFTALLLSLMRTANWDIAAAVRSIEAATNSGASLIFQDAPAVGAHYAKFALESYVNRKIFQGFDHETFYMDGSLSTLLQPDQYRRECFTQYRDMKAMDPTELLGILPTCQFGKFCSKKYLSIVHPKMEESLFGDLEQRRQVLGGNHPRSEFYGEFLALAKAVWLLHLLAFSLDPAPSHFEASKGGDFHPQYMENVVKVSGSSRGTAGMMVGFPLSPGFKLCNGSVTKARVCLLPKT